MIAAASIRDSRPPHQRLTLPLSEIHQTRADVSQAALVRVCVCVCRTIEEQRIDGVSLLLTPCSSPVRTQSCWCFQPEVRACSRTFANTGENKYSTVRHPVCLLVGERDVFLEPGLVVSAVLLFCTASSSLSGAYVTRTDAV